MVMETNAGRLEAPGRDDRCVIYMSRTHAKPQWSAGFVCNIYVHDVQRENNMAARKATSKGKKSAQVPRTRATGLASATGTAIHEAQRTDVPKGKDRGSKSPIEGTPKADLSGRGSGQKLAGAQAEPAKFSTNGQLPHRTVPSASGPVPASTVGDKAAADAAVEAATAEVDPHRQRISEATVGRLGKAELRAIGVTRGYDISPDTGTRAVRNAFLKAQAADKGIGKPEPGSVYEGR